MTKQKSTSTISRFLFGYQSPSSLNKEIMSLLFLSEQTSVEIAKEKRASPENVEKKQFPKTQLLNFINVTFCLTFERAIIYKYLIYILQKKKKQQTIPCCWKTEKKNSNRCFKINKKKKIAEPEQVLPLRNKSDDPNRLEIFFE